MDSQDEDDSDDELPVIREEPMVDTLIHVKKRISKNEKLQNESVMPTWQGAQHLIQKHRAAITNKEPLVKTNSQAMSPVLRSSP